MGNNDIVLPHDPAWHSDFVAESGAIRAALGDATLAVHHIGSTAIPGILAKPIIDLLGEVTSLALVDGQSGAIEALGYEAMGAYGIEGRRYFRKIDADGRRTHHLHVFEAGSPHVTRHLAFRDYLRNHPDVARDYSLLKACLTAAKDVSWDGYLDGKADFIAETETAALAWYRGRA